MPIPDALPVVRPLCEGFSLARAFSRLSALPGCLWLDSASPGPLDGEGNEVGRYSFLTADPVRTLNASVQDCDPWPQLDRWCRALPRHRDRALPPFQGGIAGLIGYESGSWLEPVGLARENDLPTPAISMGLYDWTIATDHRTGQSWIVSQGLGADDESSRLKKAIERADWVVSRLSAETPAVDPELTVPGPRLIAGQHRTRREDVYSNFSSAEFRRSVASIVRSICQGDSFQVNLAQRLLREADCPATDLYCNLRRVNAAPFSAYYDGGSFQVLSSSPEGFLRVRDRRVETRPIKGTTSRTGEPLADRERAEALSASQKDRAENIMIVDLMRNDLSRVCEDDSVAVTQLCEVEQYEFVQHLVSVVQGNLRDDKSVVDLLKACFPGGSITGAPKIEAMRTIATLEPHQRGPYCGSIGYISCGGDADFNILIRTITAAHGYWQIPVGGGITARSDPAAEEAETWAKAEGMLRALAPSGTRCDVSPNHDR